MRLDWPCINVTGRNYRTNLNNGTISGGGRSGFKTIAIGVKSGSDKILNVLKKRKPYRKMDNAVLKEIKKQVVICKGGIWNATEIS